MFNVTVVPIGISDFKVAVDSFPIGAFASIASIQASLIFFSSLNSLTFTLSPSIIFVTFPVLIFLLPTVAIVIVRILVIVKNFFLLISMLNNSSAFIERTHFSYIYDIYDNFGLEYYLKISSVDSTSTFYLYRSYRNILVGFAKVVSLSPNTFFLGYISVVSSVSYETFTFYSRFLDLVFLSTHWFEPKKYQKRGLGTSLLSIVVDHSRNNGAKTLRGCLTKKDISNNPGLTDWYLKNGFSLFDETPRSDRFSGICVQIFL